MKPSFSFKPDKFVLNNSSINVTIRHDLADFLYESRHPHVNHTAPQHCYNMIVSLTIFVTIQMDDGSENKAETAVGSNDITVTRPDG